MFRPTTSLASILLVASLLGGCAVAGAGILNGSPTQTASQGTQTGDKKNTEAGNKANAGKPVDKVTVSANDLIIQVKKTQKVEATVIYLDGSKDGDVQWASKDSTIVTVNPTTGEISGVKPGTATIYARSATDPDNKFAIVNVRVKEGVVEDLSAVIEPSTAEIAVGETVQLDASITNSGTKTHPNGSWSSSNQQVAFVNDEGLVTGRKAGKVTISFSSDQNSTVKAKATVTVGGGDASTTTTTDETAAN